MRLPEHKQTLHCFVPQAKSFFIYVEIGYIIEQKNLAQM